VREAEHVHVTTYVPVGDAACTDCVHCACVAQVTDVSVTTRTYAVVDTGALGDTDDGVTVPEGDTATESMVAVGGTPATWPLRTAVCSAVRDADGPHTRTVCMPLAQVATAVQPVHAAITPVCTEAMLSEQVSVDGKVICVSVFPTATGPRVLGTTGGMAVGAVVGVVVAGDGGAMGEGEVAAIGAGAIFEVVYEIAKIIQRDAVKRPMPLTIFGGVTSGMLLLYITGLLIK